MKLGLGRYSLNHKAICTFQNEKIVIKKQAST
jgi:hypothetical protein